MNTWWIPKQKHYKEETKEWWCSNCEEVTALERNPEWDGEFKGERPAPEWFVRCEKCWSEHWQTMGYECPDCGYDPYYYEKEPIHYGKAEYNRWAAMEFGGSPMNWEEVHYCPFCKTFFISENSNY